ncbi:MAG: 1-deoxy-D-xylulose-5-phosphate synthase [Oscillospiraceae bacterium]
MTLLESIQSPQDVKQMTYAQLEALSAEIRELLVETTSKTGGHLASNLGVVELTLALHRCFDCPRDAFVFDVGHQCYTHKLITGRREGFDRLRKRGGVSGFPKPCESDCDPFVVGHSTTSLSSAIGLARAKLLSGDSSRVIAIIGDGAMGGGMAYEAMDNLDPSLKNLVVVLNDNEMSISKSVGTLAGYLLRLRTSAGYTDTKKCVQKLLEHTPLVGPFIMNTITKSKSAIRRALYDGTLFEELGFNYIGPVDGHDISELCSIFDNVKTLDGPVLVHVITVKGKGYTLAEDNPGAYHGVGEFDVEEGNPDISFADSYSNTFGHALVSLARENSKICAITAAMKYGTGLQYFYKNFKERFFDVGIAEEHAVTFAAGLAKGGMKPVFSVYSTFLQRAFDQLYQDVSLCKADVMLAIDRAGVVGDDGETHQGLLDVAMLGEIGGFTVASPCNYAELEFWLHRLMKLDAPRAIRYPRGRESAVLQKYGCTGKDFDLISGGKKSQNLFITYGREFEQTLSARELLKDGRTRSDILKLNVILPLNEEAVSIALRYKRIVFAEEGSLAGGIAERFMRALVRSCYKGEIIPIAAENVAVQMGTTEEQIAELSLDACSLAKIMSGTNA